jgi:hypothetical protein
MYADLFNEFLVSSDTLRVYKGKKLLFASNKDRLLPLLEFIDSFVPHHQWVVVFDKIMGNAAALLCVKATCQEVYSPLGSELAVTTLDKCGIRHHLNQLVPYIRKPHSEEMCPMEALSLDKSPDEFYNAVRTFLNTH